MMDRYTMMNWFHNMMHRFTVMDWFNVMRSLMMDRCIMMSQRLMV